MEAVITDNKTKRYLDEKVVRKYFDEYDDKFLGVNKLTYIQFKNRVKSFMITDDMTTLQAVKKSLRMRDYTAYPKLAKENLLNALKAKFPDVYNTMRNLSRWGKDSGHAVGSYRSLMDNIVYDVDKQQYYLTTSRGVKWFLVFTNSPQSVYLTDNTEEDTDEGM